MIDRFVEVLFAFPALLLALLLIAIAGPSALTQIFAVGLGTAPGYARMVRGQILSAKGSAYVEAADGARALAGAHRARAHPAQCAAPARRGVRARRSGSRSCGRPSLSFLGLGVAPPSSEWGALLDAGRGYIIQAAWLDVIPGLVIVARRARRDDHRPSPAVRTSRRARSDEHLEARIDPRLELDLDWPGHPALGARTCTSAFLVDGVRRDVVQGCLVRARHPAQCVAIVGESGSGKSVTARALVGPRRSQRDRRGRPLELHHEDARTFSTRQWRKVRGRDVGFILQDALVSLDPLRPVKAEIAEALRLHQWGDRASRADRVIELLTRVGVPFPKVRARQRPDQLSGGLRQRALIASAIALDPDIVIADEPTTALDVTVQAQVLAELEAMKERGASLILISHDLSVVAQLADQILVMRGGEVLEQGTAAEVLGRPDARLHARRSSRRCRASTPAGGR